VVPASRPIAIVLTRDVALNRVIVRALHGIRLWCLWVRDSRAPV
jgi:hypothetical protein